MPFVDAEDVRRGTLPSWLSFDEELNLKAWTSEGPLPVAVRERLTRGGEGARQARAPRAPGGAS